MCCSDKQESTLLDAPADTCSVGVKSFSGWPNLNLNLCLLLEWWLLIASRVIPIHYYGGY